ncbi:DUF493 family protein [Myroides guanonis]|uniref:DUF493 domain-containing protein n=1 Tax=Myroides guanonis TaxID=1150112 RepID=A0A1I3UIZ7_9FLAO|nr:DUF493 family protein [Myroides guanonis]SFJ82865.1 hypothetical protein SAMN04487893_11815 [Myroides guanonis]
MDTKTEEFYERLKGELEKSTSWPNSYLFKFIVPADISKVARIEQAFDGLDAEIETRDSSTKKFTSVSIRVVMPNAEAVINKYKDMSSIEGIVSL